MEKECRKCSKTKPLSEFYKDATKKGGIAIKCKECAKMYYHEIYKHKYHVPVPKTPFKIRPDKIGISIETLPKDLDMSPERFVFFLDELTMNKNSTYYHFSVYSKDLKKPIVVVKTNYLFKAQNYMDDFESKLVRPVVESVPLY